MVAYAANETQSINISRRSHNINIMTPIGSEVRTGGYQYEFQMMCYAGAMSEAFMSGEEVDLDVVMDHMHYVGVMQSDQCIMTHAAGNIPMLEVSGIIRNCQVNFIQSPNLSVPVILPAEEPKAPCPKIETSLNLTTKPKRSLDL